MGKRFSRLRAAWGDTMNDPLKELLIKERRRLGKLATSGQKITDPEDAQRVQELISWHGRLTRRLLLLVAFYLPVSVVIDVLMARPLWSRVLLVVAWVLAVLLWLNRRRRQWRTSRVNGWSLAPASNWRTRR